MLLKVLLILFAIVYQNLLGQAQTLPAEGVYVCVRWDLMRRIGEGDFGVFFSMLNTALTNTELVVLDQCCHCNWQTWQTLTLTPRHKMEKPMMSPTLSLIFFTTWIWNNSSIRHQDRHLLMRVGSLFDS